MRTDLGLLVLRLVAGGSLAFGHGVGKLIQMMSGSFAFADPLGIGAAPSLILATFAELVCSLAVAAGLWTRWAAIPPAVTMAVAALVVNADAPWSKKELAVVYLGAFAALALTDGGRFALDALRAKRGPKRKK